MNLKFVFLTILLPLFAVHALAQHKIEGAVYAAGTRVPIAGATVRLTAAGWHTQSASDGRFTLSYSGTDTLEVTHVGYEIYRIYLTISSDTLLTVMLDERETVLDVVNVHTGYYSLPRERSTGAFSHVDQSLINRSVGPDILSRLEGVAGGLAFGYPPTAGAPSQQAELRLRGLSTINGETRPLIVVDNFPYEGDISNINPNDVESVTLLKDAAAASIWGARAGNGVLVITTKRGRQSGRPSVSVNSNLTVGDRPDLFYDQRFLPAKDLIALERQLFERGLYTGDERTAYTPAVETLFSLRDGDITSEGAENILQTLAAYDIRDEASRQLYRKTVNRQYTLGLQGGTESHDYYLSVGLDYNDDHIVGNRYGRTTVSTKNNFKFSPKMSLSAAAFYVHSETDRNGLELADLSPSGMINVYTYARLRGDTGEALPLVKKNRYTYTDSAPGLGLLDWHYRPMDEVRLNDNSSVADEIRLTGAAQYELIHGLGLELRYQYQLSHSANRNYYGPESYFARDLINTYTQADGSKPVPDGGMLNRGGNLLTAHYGRLQASFSRNYNENHRIDALGGFELRQEVQQGTGSSRIYGYSDDVLTYTGQMDFSTPYQTRPLGSARIPNGGSPGQHYTDRFVSYFGNAAYAYKGRYLLSASARWDASNIFGVDFNQQGVPLWSVGAGYLLHEEQAIKAQWLSKAKVRMTYGANGNAVRTISSLPYISYGASNAVTRLPMGRLLGVGNPDLRWEKVSTFNVGVDLGLWNHRLSASVDWYTKHSRDLIGNDHFDPTTGVIWDGVSAYNVDTRRNYANMRTSGLDVELNSVNADGRIKWESTLLFSTVSNKITNYFMPQNQPVTSYLNPLDPPVIVGNSRDQLYAIPWHGLDNTGSPQVMVNGVLGTDYNAYFSNLTYHDLIPIGLGVPKVFGSLRNTLSWKELTLSFNVTFKGGYVFRRNSVDYSALFRALYTHMDYLDRWQQPGDELATDVPSMPDVLNARRDEAYYYSEVVFEKGDHIRLQDIQLAYALPVRRRPSFPISAIRIYGYARHLGILWQRAKGGLDPDTQAMYPRPGEYAVGLQFQF
ncbi:SusC/RagA family TonB-linked outer membrane protein [Parapedobacter sp. DT-150]|uniref:SusC/RagA family TonB-linked outer membrane protein n=1 Tax=Parapedobacter sp. DT-150 TaxID=3396162 RepID=UPI003F1A1834